MSYTGASLEAGKSGYVYASMLGVKDDGTVCLGPATFYSTANDIVQGPEEMGSLRIAVKITHQTDGTLECELPPNCKLGINTFGSPPFGSIAIRSIVINGRKYRKLPKAYQSGRVEYHPYGNS